MPVVIGCLLPHPPITIPEIGKDNFSRVSSTIRAMDAVCTEVAQSNPETLIFISPHSAGFADSIAVKADRIMVGSFKNFGAPDIRFTANLDHALLEALFLEADRLGVSLTKIGAEHIKLFQSDELDHGVLVPLYYLRKYVELPIISISVSYAGADEHYALGMVIEKASNAVSKRVALIASGDLSHRLIPGAPAGYNPHAIDFDAHIDSVLDTGGFNELFELDPTLIEEAGECGLRSIYVLAGAFNGLRVDTKIHSYEGPFGVGYMVASVFPGEPDANRDFMVIDIEDLPPVIPELSEPVLLAKHGLEEYIRDGRPAEVPAGTSQELLDKRAGAFVCIKINGSLRGCIGTIQPTQANLAQEILTNVVQAGQSDPRFPPISEEELPLLDYSVDVLDEPEKIDSSAHLDPEAYGVIVRKGYKTGLLLPNIEGVTTAEHQLAIAKQKAGIPVDEETDIFRFKVTRYE